VRASTVTICVLAAGCARSHAVPSPVAGAAAATLRVPHAPGPVVLDGDNDDPGWTRSPGPARTGPFVSGLGAPARPYTDARMLWGDGHLYVLLYAADDDIRTKGDVFVLRFSRAGVDYGIEVSAGGVVRDAARDERGDVAPGWRSGAHVSREIDGTPDDARDTDEEWSLEVALPLASLGMEGQPGESVPFAIERCDVSTARATVCPQWSDGGEGVRLVLE
jgi:hypothetical protein